MEDIMSSSGFQVELTDFFGLKSKEKHRCLLQEYRGIKLTF